MHRVSGFSTLAENVPMLETRKKRSGDPRGLRGRSNLTRYCEVHNLKKGMFED